MSVGVFAVVFFIFLWWAGWSASHLVFAAAFGIAAGGIAIGFFNPQTTTAANYDRLEIGMTLAEVQKMLGRGQEVSRDQAGIVVRWCGDWNSTIIAKFNGDRLASKSQTNLQ